MLLNEWSPLYCFTTKGHKYRLYFARLRALSIVNYNAERFCKHDTHFWTFLFSQV